MNLFHLLNQSKKEKKKAQVKHNRYHQMLYELLRLRRGEEERVSALESARKPKVSAKSPDETRDKIAVIRNRLTNRQRISKERWNRFAGTGGEGGRGL